MSLSLEPQDKIKFRRRINWKLKGIEEIRFFFQSQVNMERKHSCMAEGFQI